MAQSGDVRVLLQSLQNVDQNSAIAALEMLETCVSVDDKQVQKQVQKTLAYASGSEVLEAVINAHKGNASIQECGQRILDKCKEQFDETKKKRDGIRDKAKMETIQGAVQAVRARIEQREALTNMEEHAVVMENLGYLKPELIRLMRHYPSHGEIQRRGIEALCVLAQQNAEIKIAIANAVPGLQWKEVGSENPTSGTEVSNEALATALQQRVQFSPQELDNFKVGVLSSDSYIKVADKGGIRFFEPADPCGIDVIIEAMCHHPWNTEVQKQGCGALGSLAEIEDNRLQIAAAASGLKWLKTGDTEPDNGQALEIAELAEALKASQKDIIEFSPEEWDAFRLARPALGIQLLRVAPGLQWREVGSQKPITGTEINNEALVAELRGGGGTEVQPTGAGKHEGLQALLR